MRFHQSYFASVAFAGVSISLLLANETLSQEASRDFPPGSGFNLKHSSGVSEKILEGWDKFHFGMTRNEAKSYCSFDISGGLEPLLCKNTQIDDHIWEVGLSFKTSRIAPTGQVDPKEDVLFRTVIRTSYEKSCEQENILYNLEQTYGKFTYTKNDSSNRIWSLSFLNDTKILFRVVDTSSGRTGPKSCFLIIYYEKNIPDAVDPRKGPAPERSHF